MSTAPQTTGTTAATDAGPMFIRSDYVVLGGGGAAVALAAVTHFVGGGPVLPFLCSAVAVTLLASLVGRSVEQLGDRFGPGATGACSSRRSATCQSCSSHCSPSRPDWSRSCRAALIGSILANLLLVLGLAFLVGGLKHGTQQRKSRAEPGAIIVLMVLSVAAMAVPSTRPPRAHARRQQHEKTLSLIVSVVLLLLFALTLPASLRKETPSEDAGRTQGRTRGRTLGSRRTRRGRAGGPCRRVGRRPRARHRGGRSGLPSGCSRWPRCSRPSCSDWFVVALQPAMDTLHISDAFAGLVIVAIAGNAIENIVGVQLAAAEPVGVRLLGRAQLADPDRPGARAPLLVMPRRCSGSRR